MTAQEIFDKAVGALLAQKKKSWSTELEKCVYRTDCGLKCAVGHLIPDELYTSSMEVGPSGVKTLLDRYPNLEPVILPSDMEGSEAEGFLIDLQGVHDHSICWDQSYRRLAKQYGLKWNFGEQHA